MTTLVQSLKDSLPKTEAGADNTSTSSNYGGIARMAKLMKLEEVPTWIEDLTLEVYAKQDHTWSDIFEDYPEYVKYQVLMESLKTSKNVKGLPRYVGEHVLLVLGKKTDHMIAKFLDLLSLKYERTKTEKIQEIMEDWLNFKDDQFEDNGKLLLALKELRQRKKDLNVTEDEWDAVWMLTIVKRRKRIDRFIH